MRRLSSILIEKHILIDLTPIAVDMIPADAHPDTIFYTHSHGDHFNSMTALRAGIKQVFPQPNVVRYGRKNISKCSYGTELSHA